MGSHIGAVESNCLAANRSLAEKVENVSEKAKHDNTMLYQKIEALEKKVEQVQEDHRSHNADIVHIKDQIDSDLAKEHDRDTNWDRRPDTSMLRASAGI
eukprot:12056180-Karenia_brevis.AAC.1